MPDSGLIFAPAQRLTTDTLAALAGGSIEVYEAGTTTPKAVFSDAELTVSLGSTVYLNSSGNPVAGSGSSTKVTVYTGAAKVKLVLKTSAGVTVQTIDNLQCAQDTSLLGGGGSGSGITGVSPKTSDFTILAADDGEWFACDPTSATFAATLPNAVTVGDGFAIGLIHVGTSSSNRVRYQTVGAQTILIDGQTTTADVLSGPGHAVWLVSNGANWIGITQTPPRLMSDAALFRVEERRTSPPTSPTAGARYIINGSPSGDWASFAQHDVVQANGIGGWIKTTPPADCGWLAYIASENIHTAFLGTAWTDYSNAVANPASTLRHLIVEQTQTSGTTGASVTSGDWRTVVLNTTVANTITGASVASNQITLPAGNYLVFFHAEPLQSAFVTGRFRSTTTSKIVGAVNSFADTTASRTSATVIGFGLISLTATEVFELALRNSGGGTIGSNLTFTADFERYARVTILDLSSLQGPAGAPGANGTNGTNGTNGAPGATGATGPNTGLDYAWDTGTTDANPGSGNLRVNNATLGSATFVYISKTDRPGNSQGTNIDQWDASTNTAHLGTLRVFDVATRTKGFTAEVTTAFTDGTTYWKIPLNSIQVLSGGAPSASDVLAVMWSRTGNKGADGAGTGDVTAAANFGTDNRVIRSDGTTKGVQGSAVTIDDTGNMSGVVGLSTTTIELGHASDTTLARVSAGVVSVEGETVHTNSVSRTVTAAGIELGHATDTTLARVSAGVVSIEGAVIQTAGVQEWFIPATSFAPRTTGGCATLATLETTTNRVNLPYLAFDGAGAKEFAQVQIPRMPKSWNEGTITAVVVWLHPSTTTNFATYWGISAVALSDADAADTAFGTEVFVQDTGGATNTIYHSPATSAITIGNTPAEGDTVIIQVSRDSANASPGDTMTVDAFFLGLLIRVTTNAANDA